MSTRTASERFVSQRRKASLDEYNYEHFRAKYLLEDGQRTIRRSGVRPGSIAPDFELPRADGGTVRLSELRGAPVLLHFGSFT
jgi:hypothetical protein